MVRSGSSKGRLRRLNRCHATATRHKRLCLWVKGMVSIVTSRDWVLALRVMGVDVRWELPECIRDPQMPLRTSRCTSSRRVLSRRSEGRLPVRLLWPSWGYRSAIIGHRTTTRWVALLTGLGSILMKRISIHISS
jgi:hypothetical protein